MQLEHDVLISFAEFFSTSSLKISQMFKKLRCVPNRSLANSSACGSFTYALPKICRGVRFSTTSEIEVSSRNCLISTFPPSLWLTNDDRSHWCYINPHHCFWVAFPTCFPQAFYTLLRLFWSCWLLYPYGYCRYVHHSLSGAVIMSP